VADVVLDIMEREALVERAARVGGELRERLAALESHPNVAQIRGRGLLIGIELVRDRATLEPFPAAARFSQRVASAGLAEGVLFYRGGVDPARDVIVLGPPFTIGDEEMDQISKGLERAIDGAVRDVSRMGA